SGLIEEILDVAQGAVVRSGRERHLHAVAAAGNVTGLLDERCSALGNLPKEWWPRIEVGRGSERETQIPVEPEGHAAVLGTRLERFLWQEIQVVPEDLRVPRHRFRVVAGGIRAPPELYGTLRWLCRDLEEPLRVAHAYRSIQAHVGCAGRGGHIDGPPILEHVAVHLGLGLCPH